MSYLDLARSHVERCLQDLWGTWDLEPGPDGDYCYQIGSATCYIGLSAGEPPLVKVVACAALDVKKTAKLLAELNALNTRCRTVHVYWQNGSVIVERAMFAHSVDRRGLAQASGSVATVANDIGPMIAAVFGGCTPIATLDQLAG